MNWFLVLLGTLALLALLVHTVRLVASDGRGTTPAPRSHVEELSRLTQELGR